MYISPKIPQRRITSEILGKAKDFSFLKEDKWLIDSEVKYIISVKKSLWHLIMIFISVKNPLRFRCRSIDTYYTQKKAETFAQILQRGIRKDARGTLKIKLNAFNICDN